MINLPQFVQNSQLTYDLMCRQERYGVRFDVEAAKKLVVYIDKRMEEIRQEVEPKLPSRPLNKTEEREWTPPKKQFNKDGSISAVCWKWFDEIVNTEVFKTNENAHEPNRWLAHKGDVCEYLPYHKPFIKSLPMLLKHQGHLKDWLIREGWKPTLWNYQKDKNNKLKRDDRGKLIPTSPKFHEGGRLCPSLERLRDKVDLIRPVLEWLSLRNRRSVLINESKGTGWLNNPRLALDGRLGAASSGLANTKRQKHKVVANVPRVTSLLGKEMRSLFIASEGLVMVGADASGLEDRIKGHYTYKYDDGEYAKKLLNDDYDAHQENADLWGCERGDAKSPGYALQYNCQPPKFAETLGVPIHIGKKHYEAYWLKNWALKDAIAETEREFEANFQKYITTIDGSKVVTRAKHSVFNTKCQSTGAKIMDMAGIIAAKAIRDAGIPAYRVIYYHDELQYETFQEYTEQVGEILVEAIREAGRYFNLNVPLDAEYSVGKSWADTH